VRIASLFVYPVKSARGIALTEARVTKTGLEGDRHFMIVDQDGRFFTQREAPSLARLLVALKPGAQTLIVTSGLESSEVPWASDPTARLVTVTVWTDTVVAEDAGDAVAELISRHVGQPLRLVRFGRPSSRPLAPRYGEGHSTEFSDGSPVLVASLASLGPLAPRGSPSQIPAITQFRANVVLDGRIPFEEESATHLVIGTGTDEVRLRLVKGCPRCPVIDVDPETGLRDKKTLAALARARPARSAEELAEGEKRAVYFGMDATVDRAGVVRVGDKARFERHE
jgi:uncharacterized protein